MSIQTQKIDAGLTVNETIRQFPETIAVFNEFGIDSCCGSGVAIAIAAERDGADLDSLLQKLNAAAQS